MAQSRVLYIVGANLNKEKEEELNLWYTGEHVPVLLKGPALAAERYQRMGEDEKYPKFLAFYEFENEEVMNAYIASPLYQEARLMTRPLIERGDFKSFWSIKYKLIVERGRDDRSRAFHIVGADVPPGADENEFNRWYTNQHIVFALRSPEVVKAERYLRIGDDTKYPKYLAIYRHEDEKILLENQSSFTHKAAGIDAQKSYPAWEIRWRADYNMISKERKGS